MQGLTRKWERPANCCSALKLGLGSCAPDCVGGSGFPDDGSAPHTGSSTQCPARPRSSQRTPKSHSGTPPAWMAACNGAIAARSSGARSKSNPGWDVTPCSCGSGTARQHESRQPGNRSKRDHIRCLAPPRPSGDKQREGTGIPELAPSFATRCTINGSALTQTSCNTQANLMHEWLVERFLRMCR